MQKQAPTLGKLLVMVAFALSCFGLLLFLWLAFGGSIPFASKGYRVTIPLREAGQLALQADVRISGVPVGKVVAIESNKTTKTTDALVEIDDKYAPLPKDARATTREKTLLGETYVEITPGTPGKNNMIPEGGRLSVANVSPSVQLDEILRTFDPKTRADFQSWMQNLSLSINGRGRDLSNAIGNLTPTAEDTTQLLNVLNSQQTAVSKLVANTGVVFDALSERDGQLRSLIENSNRVFATTAARDNELQQIFRILPTFETESRTTLRRLDAFSLNANPLINQLRPAARQLSPTLRDLKSLSPDLKGLFQDLGPLIDAGARGLPATDEVLRLVQPVLGQLDPFLRNLDPVVEGLGFYKPELTAFLANSTAATQASELIPGTTTKLHYLRTTNPINLENLAVYQQRLGSNRPNPYTFPAMFAKRPENRQVFEDRQCGRGVPASVVNVITDPLNAAGLVVQQAIRGTPDVVETTVPGVGGLTGVLDGLLGGTVPSTLGPVTGLVDALPPAVIGLLNTYIFSKPVDQLAPPCVRQPQFPQLGQPPAGSPATTDYPHLWPDPVPNPSATAALSSRGAKPRWQALLQRPQG